MNQKLTKGGHTSHLPLHTSNRGITLIALVITIIVLLILAGVTINMVLGDDGIIQNAQKAKERYEDEAEEEQESLDIAAGNLDLHTKGTVANTVKVGDYVEYKYDAPTKGYTTPEEGTGLEVNDETENFSSATGGNAEVTAWRVLSKKDGIVKLISEEPVSSLTLNGAKGYLNGPDVLNEMCKTLYSSDIGTGRSIKVEDINEITGYDGTKWYMNSEWTEQYFSADETRTIAEAAKTEVYGEYEEPYDMDIFASEVPEEGKYIGDYEITFYEYRSDYGGSGYDPENCVDKGACQVLYDLEFDGHFWLASSCVNADFEGSFATFEMMYLYHRYKGSSKQVWRDAYVWSKNLYSSGGAVFFDSFPFRPVVTLKTGLEIDTTDTTRNGSSTAPWQIKGN